MRSVWLYLRWGLKTLIERPEPCPERCDGPRSYQGGSWADQESPEQTWIDADLADFAHPTQHWLHVGVGNSKIAQSWSHRVKQIDGLTVVPEELQKAQSLKLPDYQVYLLDKYHMKPQEVEGPYDVIIDNNLSSYACCHYHFHRMFEGFVERLGPGGVLVTARRGMRYFARGSFGLSDRMLVRLARRYGLGVVRSGRVWVLRMKPMPWNA